MDKQKLMDKILASREQLEAGFASLSNEQMSLIILHGEWSVKDLIGHLGFWEKRVVSLFALLKAGETPEPSPGMDGLNAQAVAELRTLSLADVRRLEKTAYQRVLALLDDASETELFDHGHFAWTEGRCFADLISDNTWGHYEEHLPELVAWLKRIA